MLRNAKIRLLIYPLLKSYCILRDCNYITPSLWIATKFSKYIRDTNEILQQNKTNKAKIVRDIEKYRMS